MATIFELLRWLVRQEDLADLCFLKSGLVGSLKLKSKRGRGESDGSQSQTKFKVSSNNMGSLIQNTKATERVINLGSIDETVNNNEVFTAKYTAITFVPKCIFLQFLRLSNIVFLTNAILQSIPILSSLNPLTAIGPLGFVLGVSLIREGYQDRVHFLLQQKRHVRDEEINSRKTQVLREGVFVEVTWVDVRVGDFVKVRDTQIIPADLLLLSTSEENSMCYVETANLDGQSNLKQKFAFTKGIKKYPEEFQSLEGRCVVDLPKANLHQFDGTVIMKDSQSQYIGLDNLLLRQTTLRNTDEVVGVAVYCGYDSKILQNQGQVPHKMSEIEKKLNYIQVAFLIILAVICGTCSTGYWIIHTKFNLREAGTYIPLQGLSLSTQAGLNFLSVFILLNFLIPISLVILIEGIKTFSGIFLAVDEKFQDKDTDSKCGVLNSSILEQLGVISYVLTDKTGTLTANEMVFKKVVIEDKVYEVDEINKYSEEFSDNKYFREFFEAMTVCHEVVKDLNKGQYVGSSPDEVCFTDYTKSIGYEFVKRTKTHIELNILKEKKVFELVDILSFSSRKRMSVVVKDVDRPSQVIIYTKGADSQVFQKALRYQYERQITNKITNFAKEGLRTLLFAKRVVSVQKYQTWIDRRVQAKKSKIDRVISNAQYETELQLIVEDIEDELCIIGASGIEDRLQEEVPETIERLQRAGMVIMMITGDKLETAENIGYLAKLIKDDYKVVKLESCIEDLRTKCEDLLVELEHDADIAVIVEGRQITIMMQQRAPYFIEVYRKILLKARSVIFCRSSPKEKAQIVKFIKENMKQIVLAIGDGGNDVGMIEEANIGVGIIGKEGNSAASVSDFSFGKFKMLDRLVLHHGRWFYFRLSYFFIFYGWKNVIITFIMFFTNVQNTFSGIRNFTQFFYTLFNTLFAVAQIVYSGFYEQDINDDTHPAVWKHLPEIYKETKSKQLFSFKRYTLWTVTAIMTALISYEVFIGSLSPQSAFDSYGRIPDQSTQRIGQGMTLITNMIIVVTIDAQSFPMAYVLGCFVFTSIILTIVFYVVENYFPLLGYYMGYSDNFNMRFYLTIFAITAIVFAIKLMMNTLEFELYPSLIDTYKVNMHTNPHVLDDLLGRQVDSLSSTKKYCLRNKSSQLKELKRNSSSKVQLELVPVQVLSEEISNNSQVFSGGNILKKKASVIEGSELTLVRPNVRMEQSRVQEQDIEEIE